VAGQNGGQRILVFWLEQGVDSASWQGVKRCVDGRQHGERACAGQRLDQAGGLHGGNQRGVVGRVDGVFNDVLVGHHGGAADHRIVLGHSATDSGGGDHG